MVYPGGKNGAGVYQTIVNQIPPHHTYIEAFAGSAAVFRHKLPARTSYLIDIDPLVNLEATAVTPLVASIGGTALDRSRRGQLAPLGRSAVGGSSGVLTDRAPAGVICVCADAREWLSEYAWRGDEFVYLDPPYLAETRRGRQRRIYRCELRGRNEHRALLAVVKAIAAPVMISGYQSALYAAELKGWRVVTFKTSTRGGPADEVLWMNYPEPVALHDYRYLGDNFRQRQDFKRMRERWARKLGAMPILKRRALTAAVLAH